MTRLPAVSKRRHAGRVLALDFCPNSYWLFRSVLQLQLIVFYAFLLKTVLSEQRPFVYSYKHLLAVRQKLFHADVG